MAHFADTEFIALQAALAGEYSLDREIGRGGMGVVYLGREVRLARSVAIKVADHQQYLAERTSVAHTLRAAHDEVERLLARVEPSGAARETREMRETIQPFDSTNAVDTTDDADTPVDGISAARG